MAILAPCLVSARRFLGGPFRYMDALGPRNGGDITAARGTLRSSLRPEQLGAHGGAQEYFWTNGETDQ